MTTPRRNAIDLHTHTTRSDGVLAPLELYAAMRDYGMRLVALTDHDTTEGYTELRAAGLGGGDSPHGPQVLPGVEINTLAGGEVDWDGELHILGLGMDVTDDRFRATLSRQRALRRERFQTAVEVLAQLGMPVDDVIDEVAPADEGVSLGRPHLAQALVLKGYATSVDDAFARVLEVGRAGYVPRFGIGTREAIEAISGASGIPVLAHFREALEAPAAVDRLVAWGLRALEVYYGGGHHGFDPVQVEAMAAFARERGLLATGGSDYHGHRMDDARPVSYATAAALTNVPDACGEALLEALAAQSALTR